MTKTIRLIIFAALSNVLYLTTVNAALKPIKGNVKVGNLIMSPIGAGTWSWGNQFLWKYSKEDDDELRETFNYVTSKGVNWFDTADSYGTGALTGRSEELLGQFSNPDGLPYSTQKGPKKTQFITKLAPFPFRIGKNAMLGTFQECKKRMRRTAGSNPVDMIQLHWPPQVYQEKGFLDAFDSILSDGGATQIGMSNYGPKGLKRVDKALRQRGETNRVYSNQIQFSLLSRMPLKNGFTDVCEELGIQPIGYSPLALGLLTDKYTLDKLPSSTPRQILFREYLPAIAPLLDVLRDIAKAKRKTVSQVALNWNLQKGFLTLVGIRSVSQAKENLGAVGWALSSGEIDTIDAAAKKVKKTLIQNPNQSD